MYPSLRVLLRVANQIAILAALAVGTTFRASAADEPDKAPLLLEADRVIIDDKRSEHVYEGDVVLRQGDLVIEASSISVQTDSDGYRKGIASGGANGLVKFKTRTAGSENWITGHAERIEYDQRLQTTDLFSRAWITNGKEEFYGEHIQFNAETKRYRVSRAVPGKTAVSSESRARAVIQPNRKGNQ